MEKMIEKIEAEYQRSRSKWERLEENVLEEEYEDLLLRKYEEGYSDALAMVKQLLEEASK